MRILVTGGAGFIGAHTSKALAAAGHEPIVFDNLSTGHRWAVKWGPFEYGDLLDRAALIDVMRRHRVEAVLHFAALSSVGESNIRPDVYYRTNVLGTLSVLDAMKDAGVGQIILSSSCAVYGIPEKIPIDESALTDPINPYGSSKLMAEKMLGDYARAFNLAAVALRYFNAAGADPDGDVGEEHSPETHLIPSVLQVASGIRDYVNVFGSNYKTLDGTCVRDYVHVSDLANGHVSALTSFKFGEFRSFNLSSGCGYSVNQIIDRARFITNKEINTRILNNRMGDPPVLYANSNLAKSEINWIAKRSDIDTIISDAWSWISHHRFKVVCS
ncbi:UDP-glucose 4-epimerase GalE [Acuticoccus kandeliae]|uniref:UDP-glucose 4-epimerase GalE n=1 Tax=Acuticoccus kandeliae TaxID=2073160 RepID=UPI000D3E086A|nr:UDP-glucose 4-epimerase GalE [Acuticoccus kandeliae]